MSVRNNSNSKPIIRAQVKAPKEENVSSTQSEKAKSSIPRNSRDDFESPKPTPSRNTLWSRFKGQFKKPSSSSSAVTTAGMIGAAPAVMLGASGLVATNSASRTGIDVGTNVNFDENTPSRFAAAELHNNPANPTSEPQEFPPPDTFAARTWNKIDSNRSGLITKDEIAKYLNKVGVEPGFLGLVHRQATSEVMKMVDANKDGKISKQEIKKIVKKEIKADEFDEQGRIKPDLVDKAFKEMDTNRSGVVTVPEFEKAVKKAMNSNSLFQSTIASIARKIGMDVLDTDRDGRLTRQEFEKAAQDLAKIHASILGS